MGHYEELKTQNLGTDSDLYLALKAKLMHQKSTEEVTIIGIPPITIISDGNNATVGLKGQTVQSGTPTPDSPIMPEGTGDKTANLCATENFANSTTDTRSFLQLAIMCYYGSDFVGRATFSGGIQLLDIKTTGNKQILFTVTAENCNRLFIKHNGATRDISISNVYGAFSGDYNISFDCNGTNPTVVDGISLENIMLNAGSTPLPYEPYGIKIPISSASTTTPVYLGEVQTTRRVKKLVLTGNETVAGSAVTGGWIITNLSDSINNTTGLQTSYCSHYVAKNNGAMSSLSQGEMCISTQVNNRINFVSTFATAEDFKAYLAAQYAAGTPVTVWYVLANEETGIVNEPLMKIGDYADEVSGITIPTIKGTNIVDIDTEVKPSEISITYTKGKEISINNISDMEKLTIADLEKMTIAELEG